MAKEGTHFHSSGTRPPSAYGTPGLETFENEYHGVPVRSLPLLTRHTLSLCHSVNCSCRGVLDQLEGKGHPFQIYLSGRSKGSQARSESERAELTLIGRVPLEWRWVFQGPNGNLESGRGV